MCEVCFVVAEFVHGIGCVAAANDGLGVAFVEGFGDFGSALFILG